MKSNNYILKCINCGKEFSWDSDIYTCDKCGNRNGTLEVMIDFNSKTKIKSERKGIWRYIDFLPLNEENIFDKLLVGDTPIITSDHIAEELGIAEFLIKDDGRNPTASFKDRASVMAVSKCFEKGYEHIFAASTGNAASSISGIGVAAGLKVHIFVPASAPDAKITQLMVYGADVNKVIGTYDQAFDISLEIGMNNGWYCRNSAVNPFLLEGKKTGTYEFAEQLDFKLPDIIMVSVGDGTIYSSIHKAVDELYDMKMITKKPTIVGVQGENSNAIQLAFEKGRPFASCDIENPECVADSISVGKPRDYLKACKYAYKNDGFFISVDDHSIGKAIIDLARYSGVFAEPAGAVAFAGARKLSEKGYLNHKTRIGILVTGNGLKDINSVKKYLNESVNEIKI